jgi:RNA polymerase sigma-70 factor (ECF subfamily)
MARDREGGLVLMDEPAVAPLQDFDEVARLHRPAVFRFLLASLRNTDIAETLTQDCLLKAYRARESFRGDSGVRTWLMRIAVNLLNDHYASARLRFWRRVSQSNVDVSTAAQWVADRQASPESAAAAKQQVDAIWRAAGSLSHQQRTVLLLRFVEDMDLLEIAEATGMKEGTVKAHLFRAIRNVRSELEKQR